MDFNSFLQTSADLTSDLQYTIENPTEPYNEWFATLLAQIAELQSMSKDVGGVYVFLKNESFAKKFNIAVDKYLIYNNNFEVQDVMEENKQCQN